MSSTDSSQSSILRISDNKTLQLVISYGDEPCLWNTTHRNYKNKEARAAATERIARALDVPNFEARHVTIKFKNLRNSYCQELKKIAACFDMGLSGDQVYQPKVAWFHHMDAYLRPHLQPSMTKTIVDQLPAESSPHPASAPARPRASCRTVQVKEEQEEDTDSDSSPLEDWLCVGAGAGAELADDNSYQSKVKRPRWESAAAAAAAAHCVEQAAHACMTETFMKNIARNLETITRQRDDHYDSFGRYVASVLRAMERGRALALQPRLVALLTHGLLPDDAHVSQSHS